MACYNERDGGVHCGACLASGNPCCGCGYKDAEESSAEKADAVIGAIDAAEGNRPSNDPFGIEARLQDDGDDLRPLGMHVPAWWDSWQRYAEERGGVRMTLGDVEDIYEFAQAVYERGWMDRHRQGERGRR